MEKPKVKLTGTDGNVFSLLARCTKALKEAQASEQVKPLTDEVFNSGSYHEALNIMSKYCDIS